ncbi:Imm71 family immunity protein, partial [Massilia glaciei]
MSIFDIFKPKWSEGQMRPDDRRKIFWYLKRKTSYTAWHREADAFDRFANIFERQVREEPVALPNNSICETNWERFYPDILKTQVLYEQGLERLKQGDRSVWLYNERGILRDATMNASDWHCYLVTNGPRGDNFFDGKYVDAMTDATRIFFDATQDTGYVQSMMSDTPAPELWGTGWYEKFSKMPIPAHLPDVPEPHIDVFLRTGEMVTVFGIYEPQIKDGCMNYLLAGAEA